MHSFETDHYQIKYDDTGQVESQKPLIIWGHGWGQSHAAFAKVIGMLAPLGRHVALDFPGFGESPVPFDRVEDSWGSREYADAVAPFIRQQRAEGQKVIWVGHSFGCRVGTQLGAVHPDCVDAMVYIGGAGLKRKRSALKKMILWTKIRAYKMGKALRSVDWLDRLFHRLRLVQSAGSTDYQRAGPMRGVLVKVVNEHLSAEAARIQCPVLLLYGDNDDEAPVDIGQQFHALIKNSKLVCFEGQDHYSLLDERGCHQVVLRIKQFIETL